MNSVRHGAAVVQRYLVSLYFIGVLVQFFLVGVGLFSMKAGSNIDNAKSLDAHRGFGYILVDFVGGLLLIATLIAWQKPLGRKGRPLHPALPAGSPAGSPRNRRLPPQVHRHVPPRGRTHPPRALRPARSDSLDGGACP